MRGLALLLGVLWTCGSSAESRGQLLRTAVQAPLVKYNFIFGSQEGIAPDSGRVDSETEASDNQVDEVTTVVGTEETGAAGEDVTEGRRVEGGGWSGAGDGADGDSGISKGEEDGGGPVGEGGSGSDGGAGDGGGGVDGGGGGDVGERVGGGEWSGEEGNIKPGSTEQDMTQSPYTVPSTSIYTTSTTTPKPIFITTESSITTTTTTTEPPTTTTITEPSTTTTTTTTELSTTTTTEPSTTTTTTTTTISPTTTTQLPPTTTTKSPPITSEPPTTTSEQLPITTTKPLPTTTQRFPTTTKPLPTSTKPPPTTPKPHSTTQIPKKTTTIPGTPGPRDVSLSCDFGMYPNTNTCEWVSSEGTALTWQTGTGQTFNWLGGPTHDFSSDINGGYTFVETSQFPLPQGRNTYPGAILQSPLLRSTGPKGSCITFAYMMDGLSPAQLRVILQIESPEESARLNMSGGNVLWQAEYHTQGEWVPTQFLYTCEVPHKIMFQGIPVDLNDPSRLYRGFIAVDKIQQSSGSYCRGFCSFAAGFCDWGNEQGDDFDWSLSRGSRNSFTGPTSDRYPDRCGGGGYIFIDSSFPRRPGDLARLSSLIFPSNDPNAPWCLRFWFHMFGPVVGTLRVLLRVYNLSTPSLRQVWRLSGSAGNAWFMAQVTVSSVHDFQIVLEASVGNTGMSDIAVDDLIFVQGPCPVAPQVAATSAGDCTFEVDECGWISNKKTKGRDGIEWQRMLTRTQNPRFRRRPPGIMQAGGYGNEYYLNLGQKFLQPTVSTAQLISMKFSGSEQPQCLCFWYFMYEPFIDISGPSLGVLRVLLQTGESQTYLPFWQLTNNQGPNWKYGQVPIRQTSSYKVVFEGTWGPNRAGGAISIDDISFYEGQCSIKPLHATVRSGDCSFESGICGWKNVTRSDSNERLVSWQMAFDMHRPAELLDRTFGTSDGYVFFDIFTTNQQQSTARMLSPVIDGMGSDDLCFTFWYFGFGAAGSTQLRLLKTKPGSASGQMMWKMTADGYDPLHPTWTPAQFTIDARLPFTIMLEGQASNGGFAVDDIKTLSGTCETRPSHAEPAE